MIEALCDVLSLRGFFALGGRLSVLETVLSAVSLSVSCVRSSALVCCFSFVHCAGHVHGLSSLATDRFTL